MRTTLSREAARARVAEMLALVQLSHLAARYPRQLSGGQQQRVAMARALVSYPRLLLMDEPLGALDKKLREQMQIEIKQIHRSVGTTMVYVTHDQSEAMTMSDLVVVMHHSRIAQVGTPRALYEEPASLFVADFLGDFEPAARQDRRDRRRARAGRDRRRPASSARRPARSTRRSAGAPWCWCVPRTCRSRPTRRRRRTARRSAAP